MPQHALKHFKHWFVTPPKDMYNYSNTVKNNLVTLADENQVKHDAEQNKYLTTRSIDTYVASKIMEMSENNMIGHHNRKVIRLSR